MKHGRTRLFSIILLLMTTQCRWNQPPPENTIVFAISSQPKNLDPRLATGANSQRIIKLLFSSLIKTGPKLDLAPDLATHWNYSDLVYEFHIRPQVRFSNGRPLKFEDFVFSINEFQKDGSPFAGQFSIIKKISGNYQAETGGVIRLHLSEYSASLLNDLTALMILPKAEIEADENHFLQTLVGTGPLQMHRIDSANIVVRRSETFYGKKSLSEFIHFKVIKDASTRFMKLYKGQIDIIQSDVPFSKISVFKDSPNFTVHTVPGLSVNYILLNLRNPILANREIRYAISQGINRQEIIKYTLEGYAEIATSILTPAHPFFDSSLSYTNLAKADLSKLSQIAQGKPMTLKTSNSLGAIENGKILAQQLRQLGLKVQLQSYEWGTYYEDVKSGNFDIAIMKWVGITDPAIYRISLHSQMVPPGRNRGYYSNAEFDKLVDLANREPNLEKRKQLYQKVQKIVFSDLPTIPLWYEKQVAISHQRVKDYSLPLSGDFSSLTKVYKSNEQ